MKTTSVRVTDKHIAEGEPSDPFHCAFAVALRDTLAAEGMSGALIEVSDEGGEWSAIVEQADEAGYRRFRAELDEEAVEFVQAFDARDEVGPCEFELAWQVMDQ